MSDYQEMDLFGDYPEEEKPVKEIIIPTIQKMIEQDEPQKKNSPGWMAYLREYENEGAIF